MCNRTNEARKRTGLIKLNSLQNEALKKLITASSNDIEEILELHARKRNSGGWKMKTYESLNGLCQCDMARALLIGYRVEDGESNA
ncbi:hypothetical protein ABZ756_07145 [Mammaliicoccus sciuri]|uniref:hypothetical protein n=1 Tax=Sporosarcina sp. FSL W7-1283 TaxID=2921560 RepID=UPI0030F5FC6A